ncbi:MAG: Fic family protein [Candidatus Saganbacteria bacterium]|uniref:Fic family protein n=1 Tax=Candidatus Saganbacteria bacterium TaxID=2575572 RepID=A0A833L1V1_UNCSA|nr:MAG: Fic family protein [Candidatus Saganbacteria bacterium]
MLYKRFDKRLNNLPAEIWNKITKIDELKGQWIAGAKLSPQVLGRLKRSVLITSTGSSTRIEGARLSDNDVEKLMNGISLQKFSNRDKQEVKGYFELLRNIFDAWEGLRFSESAIKHFHKELLKYAEKDERHRGEYKKKENKVVMIDASGKAVGTLFDTTPAYLTPKEMLELVEWTQNTSKEKKYHPLLIAANFVVEFLNIHPFEDGNGRLSRILTNLLLLKEGYLYIPCVSHEKLVEENKPEYYMALRKSQKTFKGKNETIIPWLDFFLSIFHQQSKMAIDLLSAENIEKLLSPKQLAVWEYLQSVSEAAPLEISKKAKVARPTVNQALDKLLSFKKIERIGLGRSTRYRKIA